MKKKILVACLCVALAVLTIAGTTLAYLTSKTDAVVNTFTVGNINITLTETTTDYKMVPGNTIAKNPKVTVTGGSEDCWLFVKIDESTNPKLSDYIEYSVTTGTGAWTKGDGTNIPENVYYREVKASAKDQAFDVLTNNQVTVKTIVTTGMMNAVSGDNAKKPTLTFTAYAVQSANLTVQQAWEQAKTLDNTTNP